MRISDVCSNIGVATVVRVEEERIVGEHSYMSLLHAGQDENFNAEYEKTGREYFGKLAAVEKAYEEEEKAEKEKAQAAPSPVKVSLFRAR